MRGEDSQTKNSYQEAQLIEYDSRLHHPPPCEPPKPPAQSHLLPLNLAHICSTPKTTIPKASILVATSPFDEEAVNLEFREEYEQLEKRSRQLDLSFQDLVKDLRLWIAASVDPVTEEEKRKYVCVSRTS
jgi:hypothetical protein